MDSGTDLVETARLAATEAGFACSSDERVGALLEVLAGSVPTDGRILELGTGTGVGTAWLVSGLGERSDVEVVTIESDASRSALAQRQTWPPFVRFLIGDAVELLEATGSFDLIFADAQGGKWDRLDLTLAALRPRGVLVVDDMTPGGTWTPEQHEKQAEVRRTLLHHPALSACELEWATGVILAVAKTGAATGN